MSKLAFILSLAFLSVTLHAQEIDFGSFSSSYSVTLSELSPGSELDFGTLIQNDGVSTVTIDNAKVLTIEGVKYLDIIVDLTADQYLLLNGNLSCQTNPSCRIPYTLQASYANRGIMSISQVSDFLVSGTTASEQFPIKYRGNVPPGPPPTPVYEGFNTSLFNETAYIYIYGSVNVGNVDAGSYTGTVNVTINYD